MDSSVSRSNTHETIRKRQVRGGKPNCSRPGCNEPHTPGSGYCYTHHAAYMREWRARERERIKALEAMVGTWVEPA